MVSIVNISPTHPLSDFVDSFWSLDHASDTGRDVVILPDGRIDLFFSRSATEPFHITLMGLGTQPEEAQIVPYTRTFAISFKLPAVEYILGVPVAGVLNQACRLPADFWGFTVADLDDFTLFQGKAMHKLQELLPKEPVDERKRLLFSLLYVSNGATPVQELSERSFWSSRQINRYFTTQFGLSLKAYCNILRFRSAFGQLSAGKLFPDQSFADQSHFIKEVKRLSGVLPKDLGRNQNGRFIQFSTLARK